MSESDPKLASKIQARARTQKQKAIHGTVNMSEAQQLPAPKKPKTNYPEIQLRIARTLFCSSEFAQIPFRDMNIEDWQVLASRAWKVAGTFVEEMKRLKK